MNSFSGRTGLDDHAAIHEGDLVGDLPGEAHLVGDHDHRHPGGGQVGHQRQHALDQFRVERRGGLVEQHHLGRHRQRPGDRDPLLLAAGEVARSRVTPCRRSPTSSSWIAGRLDRLLRE